MPYIILFLAGICHQLDRAEMESDDAIIFLSLVSQGGEYEQKHFLEKLRRYENNDDTIILEATLSFNSLKN